MTEDERKRRKNRRLGKVAAALMRLVSSTLRYELHDHCGFLENRPKGSLIHAVWHNSIFAWPAVYRKHWPDRQGAALTSASRDGEVVAAVLESFGLSPVRGSNSRRGAAAIIELKKWLTDGYDIAITPDGPRGPKHHLQPGIVILAQKSRARIMPYRLIYRSAWRLKTWDEFQIPKPFSKVEVHFGEYLEIPEKMTEEEFEEQRQRVEKALLSYES